MQIGYVSLFHKFDWTMTKKPTSKFYQTTDSNIRFGWFFGSVKPSLELLLCAYILTRKINEQKNQAIPAKSAQQPAWTAGGNKRFIPLQRIRRAQSSPRSLEGVTSALSADQLLRGDDISGGLFRNIGAEPANTKDRDLLGRSDQSTLATRSPCLQLPTILARDIIRCQRKRLTSLTRAARV